MTPLFRSNRRGRRRGVVVGLSLLLLGAGLLWQHASRLAAPSDATLRAATALAEVCTTPARLPRRSVVVPRPRRDPFVRTTARSAD